MYRSYVLFKQNIDESRHLSTLYTYVRSQIAALNVEDLLRSQIVYSLSAFDKLIHDLIRIGMLEIFSGKRVATLKYLSEGISLDSHNQIVAATIPPKEYYFEMEIEKKHKVFSYQDPDKIAEGLSLVWSVQHKWQDIANYMGMDSQIVRTTLKTITDRRNKIVHEADIDISTGKKYLIDMNDTIGATDFIFNCGTAIFYLVKI
jgi:hypothetical protein